MIYETNHRHKKGSDLWHLVSTCRHLNMKIIRWTDINLTHNYEGFFFLKKRDLKLTTVIYCIL